MFPGIENSDKSAVQHKSSYITLMPAQHTVTSHLKASSSDDEKNFYQIQISLYEECENGSAYGQNTSQFFFIVVKNKLHHQNHFEEIIKITTT